MKISVIIPIYNSKEYLEQCIDSVLHQKWKDFELLLIDDGSNDGSEKLVDLYAAKDSRIRVIHKVNEGLVNARKTGVEIAKGEYICWVDSDDWVENTFLCDFISIIDETRADAVAMSLYQDINNSSTLVKNGLNDGVYHIETILDKILYNGNFFEYGICPHLVTKMFKRSLLLETQLTVDDKIVAGEDAAVTYPSLLSCKTVAVCNKANYHYVQHAGSITKTKNCLEAEKIDRLIKYLQQQFKRKGVYENLKNQLRIYENYLKCLRQIDLLDDEDVILKPFGGIEKYSNIIVYGAGVLGQRIYYYINDLEYVNIIDWVDKNYKKYRNDDLDVNSPEKISELKNRYDYIIVANITGSVAMTIKNDLMTIYNVQEDKIRWFTEEFQKGID